MTEVEGGFVRMIEEFAESVAVKAEIRAVVAFGEAVVALAGDDVGESARLYDDARLLLQAAGQLRDGARTLRAAYAKGDV